MISAVPAGLHYVCVVVPGDKSLGYYQMSLSGQRKCLEKS